MLSRSYESTRVASMINAMRENGPMSIAALVKQTGWSHETIRSQIRKLPGTFQQMSQQELMFGGSTASLFYLTNDALGISEEELERKTDEMYRDLAWWPKADNLVISTINAMIKSGATAWQA
jgi:hypothetical protein